MAALPWIALGGAIGSVARALVGAAVPAGAFPWATLIINVLGSLAIGALMGAIPPAQAVDSRAHAFAVVGLCGGFTTFSAFSWQTFERMQRGEWTIAIANVAASVVLCLLATWAGWRMTGAR